MNDFYHVCPLNDLREHNTEDRLNCWCVPIEDGGIIIHNSMDKREEYENGRKKH